MARVLGDGIVQDDNGDTWVRASAVCHGHTCGKPSHRAAGLKHMPPTVNCTMIRGWEASGRVTPVRVGREKWYKLSELREADFQARQSPDGWVRGRPRPQRRRSA